MKQIFVFLLFVVMVCNSGNSQVLFQEHVIGNPDQRVTGIVSEDFDLDGDLDIITCLRTENIIMGWENIDGPFPSFSANSIAENIQGPFYICSSDLNQDNYPDIVVSLVESNRIIALFNPGNLSQAWTQYIVTDNFDEPHGVAIADVNGDALVDIIATAAADNTIAFWQNNGGLPDTWTKFVITDDFQYTQSIDVMDFENDGDVDVLAAANQENSIALWINDGNANPDWEKVVVDDSFSMAHDAKFADANGDGLIDIFGAAFGSNQIACWLNSGQSYPTFSKIIIDNDFSSPLTICAEDIDKDGDLDAVGSAWGIGTVAWFENQMNISAGWEKHIITDSLRGAWPLCLVDIEGDEDIDVFAGADILGNSGTNGTFALWENLYTTIGIETNTIDQKPYNIQYYKSGREIWLVPEIRSAEIPSLLIFDSLGRQISSSSICNSDGNKTVFKIPVNLGSTGIFHISIIAGSNIIARESILL